MSFNRCLQQSIHFPTHGNASNMTIKFLPVDASREHSPCFLSEQEVCPLLSVPYFLELLLHQTAQSFLCLKLDQRTWQAVCGLCQTVAHTNHNDTAIKSDLCATTSLGSCAQDLKGNILIMNSINTCHYIETSI
jgi:hypothetical protein